MVKKSDGFTGESRWYAPETIIERLSESPIIHDMVLMGIGYYPCAKFHFYSRTEIEAKYYVLIYCQDGCGFYETDGQKHEVRAGDVFILLPNKPHRYYSDLNMPWTIYWLHFRGDAVLEYIKSIEFPIRLDTDNEIRSEYRQEIFIELFNSVQQCETVQNLAYSSSVLHHYLGTLCFCDQFCQAKVLDDKNSTNDFVSRAVNYMKENVNRNLTLSEIADYLDCSASHFSGQFKQKTGMPPLRYLTDTKIKLACKYLEHSDYKINQICFFVGFDNPLYFTRVFCKFMGVSPTEYRQRLLQK